MAAWSYPIIRNGLIYFVDIRNGLYIVRYTGPGKRAVGRIRLLEGNSNIGDAARLDRYSPFRMQAALVGDALGEGASGSGGLALSCLAFLGAIGFFIRTWRRHRPAEHQTTSVV